VFNPGSCGQPHDCVPLAAHGVLDTQTGEAHVQRAEYDIGVVQARCAELGFDAAVCDIPSKV
jgi:hypothetical protein